MKKRIILGILFSLLIISVSAFAFLNKEVENDAIEMKSEIQEKPEQQDPSKKQKKKHPPYICEVKDMNGEYQELWDLSEFEGDYTKIKSITIQNQGITDLPKNLTKFTNIELLDLSHNKLSTVDIDVIKEFKKLKRFYINHNSIHDTAIDKIKTQLPSVDVYNNSDVSK